MDFEELVKKYGQPGTGIPKWEYLVLDVSREDIIYDMNRYGELGWEALRPIGKKSWLFKRQKNHER